MKLLSVLLSILLLTFCLVACSDDDDDSGGNQVLTPPLATVPDTTMTFPMDLSGYDSTTVVYDGADQTAFSLEQFIPNLNALTGVDDEYDARSLYAYNIVAPVKSFSPRDKGYTDLTWEQLITGVFLPNVSGGRTFFASDDIPTAFDVKNHPSIEVYRRVDIIREGTNTLIELDALTTSALTYVDSHGNSLTVNACNLDNILGDYVAGVADSLKFTAIDNYTCNIAWNQAQASYLIPESGKAVVLDSQNTQLKAVKFLKTINLFN